MRNPMQKAISIVSDFCTETGITSQQLREAPSTRTWTELRRELSERLRRDTTLSWSEIGEILGRHHWRDR